MTYSIYEIAHSDGSITRKWGKAPEKGASIIEKFSNYQVCKSNFHQAAKIIKFMEHLLTKAKALNLPERQHKLIEDACSGEGWPVAPIVSTAITRARVVMEVMDEVERERIIAGFAPILAHPDTVPGKCLTDITEGIQYPSVQAAAAAIGVVPNTIYKHLQGSPGYDAPRGHKFAWDNWWI